jgi:pimeloyl-ACP methyl ester carboxylesterase
VTEPRTWSLPVDGGDLAVAEWGDPAGPVVLAVHGITASSRAWPAVARLLPEVRLVAPDLRGRGRSNRMDEPYGLRQHAVDLGRLADRLGAERIVVAGHSMGGFPAVLLAAARPDVVGSLLLLDGGLPLALPPGMDDAALLATEPGVLLGPAWDRLRTVYPGVAEYQAFWRAHPAFAGDWTEDVAAYAAYDLEPVPGGFRPSSLPEAVATDLPEQFGPDWYLGALGALAMPVTLLRAPLGLLAEPPGLYPPDRLDAFRRLVPHLRIVEVPGVNHYTLVMTRPGADAVAGAVHAAIEGPAG